MIEMKSNLLAKSQDCLMAIFGLCIISLAFLIIYLKKLAHKYTINFFFVDSPLLLIYFYYVMSTGVL